MIRAILAMIFGCLLLVACAESGSPQHDPDNLLEINRSIDVILSDLSTQTGSIRTVVRQFHEGETDFLGNREIVVSEQYVHEAPGFALLIRESDASNMPMSWFQQTIKRMWDPEGEALSCYTFEVKDLHQSQIKALLQLHNVHQIAGCPLTDPHTGAPMGILSLSFMEPLDTKENVPMLRDTERAAEKIEQLLGNKRGSRHKIL